MVDRGDGDSDGSAVPTIAAMLTSYRDRTGHSYRDMARKVRDEMQGSRLQQLATSPPKAFPERRTIELLSELLEVPTATVVLAFAAGLGIPVSQTGTMLERTLPPGTDALTAEDREAIRAVTRALVEARNEIAHGAGSGKSEQVVHLADLARLPLPDLSRVAARRGKSEGRRMREEQDRHGEQPEKP